MTPAVFRRKTFRGVTRERTIFPIKLAIKVHEAGKEAKNVREEVRKGGGGEGGRGKGKLNAAIKSREKRTLARRVIERKETGTMGGNGGGREGAGGAREPAGRVRKRGKAVERSRCNENTVRRILKSRVLETSGASSPVEDVLAGVSLNARALYRDIFV